MQPHVLTTVDPAQLEVLRNGLRIMALRALGDADQAEDIVQEAMLRALHAVTPEVAGDAARLGAFVGGIARHVIADVRRRQLRFTALPSELPAAHASDALSELIQADERRAVERALASLPARDRSLLHDSFFLGLSPAALAAASGEPAERVRKRKSRAMERLRTALLAARHEAGVAASKDEKAVLAPTRKGGR